MKKIIVLAIFICVITAFAFGQSYTVQSVTGRVEREAAGQRVVVKAGESLNADTVIHTGIGASIVLTQGDKTSSIPAARNGKVAELVTASTGVRITGNVARVGTATVTRTTAQVSTASARASDAARDEDVAAE